MPDIPKTCRAAVVKNRGPNYELVLRYDWPVPTPAEDEILLKLSHTGLCFSDIHNCLSDLGLPSEMDIIGHEGSGEVVALGSRVTDWKIGDRAGMKPGFWACQACEACKSGYEGLCLRGPIQTAWKVPGSYCQYVVHKASYATRMPFNYQDLPGHIAAPLQCGGATTYKAVKESGLRIGQWLVVSGAGGGVGSLACLYARAAGIRVIGIDTGDAKKKFCLEELGCEAFIDFKTVTSPQAEVKKITERGAHAIIVTGGTPAAYANWWEYLRFGGRLVVVGLPPKGSVVVGAEPVTMVLNSYSIHAVRVGTLRETEECCGIAAAGLIKPNFKVYPFEDFPKIIKMIQAGQLPGRAVIKFED